MTLRNSAAAFQVDRTDLLAALTVVAKIPDKRNTMPILSNVLVEVTPGAVRLSATDLDIQVTRSIPAEVTGEGVFTVPAGTVFDLVRKLPADARITVAEGEQPGTALLRAGRSRYTLHTLPATDWPNLQTAADFPHVIEANCGLLAGLFATVAFAISTEETRYYLNGTYMHVVPTGQGNALRLVATDGHRLARVDSLLPTGLDPAMPGIIVPTKAQGELRRLCEATPEATITLEVSASQIRATKGDTVFVSKLIDGTFPDYQRVIPREFSGSVKVVCAEVSAAVERALVVSVDKGRAIGFRPEAASMEIANRNDAGEAVEEVDVEAEVPAGFSIGFNGKYLAEILGNVGADTATIKLTATNGAAVIVAREDSPALFVLMPMQVRT